MLGLRAFELHESSFVLAGPASERHHSSTPRLECAGRSVAFTVGRETARNHSTTTPNHAHRWRILLESGLNMVTPITVVLAVGLDSWRLTSQDSDFESAGYVVISASSIEMRWSNSRSAISILVLLGSQFLPNIKNDSPASFALLAHARPGLHPEPFRRPQFVSGWDPPGRCKARSGRIWKISWRRRQEARQCRRSGPRSGCWGSISLN